MTRLRNKVEINKILERFSNMILGCQMLANEMDSLSKKTSTQLFTVTKKMREVYERCKVKDKAD